MSYRRYALILLLVLAMDRVAWAQTSVAPEAGVLVLRNGQVIEGDVTRAGDYYIVSLGEGSEVRPKADDVELFCGSMEEAYQFKVRHLSGLSAKSHLELANWCLRHGLFVKCSEQLTAATRLEPNNLQVKDLETRLKLAVETPPAPSAAQSAPTVAADELEKVLRELPRGSVEKFGAIVQPILLNRCGANQCHGPNAKSEFRLLRPPPGQTVSRRFTQRNLHTSLRYIDASNPEASPLVMLPQQRHGNSLAAVFDKHSVNQLAELLAWAKMTVAPSPLTPPNVSATITPPTIATTLSQPAPALREPPAEGSSASPSNADVGKRTTNPPMRQAASSAAGPLPPAFRDRYDPEIFNRRYHGK